MWWLSLVLCLDSFFFFVCISIIDFWIVVTMAFIYSNLYIDMIVLSCWSLNFKCTLRPCVCTLLPSRLLFLISYFMSNCFVYPLTAYCGYRWFYYFCLLIFLLTLYMDDFLPLLYVYLYWWAFTFCNFHASYCGFFFFTWKSSFNLSCKAGLVMLNFSSFCLSVKLLMTPIKSEWEPCWVEL